MILEATTLVRWLCAYPCFFVSTPGDTRRVPTSVLTHDKAAVPSLVASVKDAGLLLATFGDAADIASLRLGASDGRQVDAFVIDG